VHSGNDAHAGRGSNRWEHLSWSGISHWVQTEIVTSQPERVREDREILHVAISTGIVAFNGPVDSLGRIWNKLTEPAQSGCRSGSTDSARINENPDV
jgi:hypothetical protein